LLKEANDDDEVKSILTDDNNLPRMVFGNQYESLLQVKIYCSLEITGRQLP